MLSSQHHDLCFDASTSEHPILFQKSVATTKLQCLCKRKDSKDNNFVNISQQSKMSEYQRPILQQYESIIEKLTKKKITKTNPSPTFLTFPCLDPSTRK
jgi:hypothetical protein